MFINNINPVLFHIGSLEIRYYGIFLAAGVLVIFLYLMHLSKKKEIDLDKWEILEGVLWGGVGVLICSRLFYALVYNFSYFWNNPMQIFAINQGGLSFHGGFIGLILGGYLYCRIYKKDFWKIADFVAVSSTIGICLVKIGNFTNSGLVGRITEVHWGVNFNNEVDSLGNLVYRHPSQLYEAAKNLVILAILLILKRQNLKKGSLFAAFMMLYSFFRFFIGFFRAPDPQVGYLFLGLTMGQILNIIMFACGVGVWVYLYKYKKSTTE